ncbi:MAG: hypothetical protein RLZZ628_3315 [Bacteroidota bacterium]|jgi:uncharacterized protein with ParB-like and HNH nuclease domain
MKANEGRVEQFLSTYNTVFTIPVYQRNYEWTNAQCKQLFTDIEKIGQDETRHAHFIGSVVYVHDDIYSASGLTELTLIDGQQRLTTIILIYTAVAKLCKALGDTREEQITKTYLINQFAKESDKLKLRPTEANEKALKFIIHSERGDGFKGGYSRLIENYDYFSQSIHQNNYEIILRGLSKLMFINIALDRYRDDPQRIFESLNSTGLELSQADLIRNYILMDLKRDQQNFIYKQYWEYIEQHTKDEVTTKTRMSDFIRDFLTVQTKEIPNKSDIYMKFKEKYPRGNFDTLENTLKMLRNLSPLYYKLLNPRYENDKEIRLELEYISRLEINVAHPFLMKIYEDYSTNFIDKKDFIEILNLVQSYAWRRFVVGLGTEGRNKVFMNLYEKVDRADYLKSVQIAFAKLGGINRFPDNQETKKALKLKDFYNVSPRRRLYFLEKLENFQNKELVKIENNSNLSVEHIFPQTPEARWKTDIGVDDFGFIKEHYLHTIANLTLTGYNSNMGNKPFLEKRDMAGGYKDSRLWLNKQLSKCEKWDKREVEKRFEAISERFFKIWLEVRVDGTNAFQEVNIFEAETPRNKKLEYAIFKDKKLQVNKVSELYMVIIKELLNISLELFFTTDLGAKLNLSKPAEPNAEPLRQTIWLNDLYAVEGNMDSIHKFEKIKYALTVFDLQNELFIKYVDN